eukprot:s213_g8.t1
MNYVWPNVFENSPHLIMAVFDAIDGFRISLGPTKVLQYLLQGLWHPARRVRPSRLLSWKMPAVKGSGYSGDTTPSTRASDAPSGSPQSSCSSSPTRKLAKDEVLELQNDLIQEFSSPAFQKKLRQASSLHAAGKLEEYRKAQLTLVRDAQRTIIPRHGFPASDRGVDQMLLSLEDFQDDPDVAVNQKIIQEHLSACEVPEAGKEHTAIPLGHDKKALGKRDIIRLLKSLKEQLAPCFGFQGSKEGVLSMISECGKFLTDPEVAELFDAVNAKLGMSPAACKAFRAKAVYWRLYNNLYIGSQDALIPSYPKLEDDSEHCYRRTELELLL